MRGSRPLARAAMERSGFWRDPSANVLQESPAERVDATREREVSASHLDQLTLKRMRHQNPIDAENSGSGPKWGSTTSGTTFCEHQSSHDRFREIDRSLIGSRESTSFSRQRVAIGEGRIEEPISTAHDCYRPKELARGIHIPNHTVMEPSGFATAAIPTQTHVAKMSEVTAADLPAATVAEMRRKSTPEYQNLFEPTPYRSIHRISFGDPGAGSAARDVGPDTQIRRRATGYDTNETVSARPPGGPRHFRTGATTTVRDYRDPEELRTRDTHLVPDVVERSGYWAG
jgi:hypothetical protein